MPDPCPHNIGWPSPQLERRQRRDNHPFGQRLLGLSEQWGLWNTPKGNPGQNYPVASTALASWQRVLLKKEKKGGGPPKFPVWATKNVVVCTWVGKEFPDMRWNEREIKFIRVGDAIRTAGQIKGDLTLNRGP